MWTAWCTRLKNTQKVAISDETEFLGFLKNRILRKLTTEFENRIKHEAATKECVFYSDSGVLFVLKRVLVAFRF